MQIIRILLIILIYTLQFNVFIIAQTVRLKKITIDEYIYRYTPIAKTEMRRTGIPASIKLAQGILESSYGNSPLATEANNHFGIKCHTGYQGKGYYMNDDAENECFRIYESPEESFIDHSEFLRSRPRYADLFKLDPKDYKSWAKGLKEAGYATNPQYANLLIRMIEDRNLHQYDTADPELAKTIKTEEDVIKNFENKILLFNGLKTVIAQNQETYADIAERFGVAYKKIKKYNEFADEDTNFYLIPGTKVYLQNKKPTGLVLTHKVLENETMQSISQKEGIQLKKLYSFNLMKPGEEPALNENLYLQKKAPYKAALKTEREIEELQKKMKKITSRDESEKEISTVSPLEAPTKTLKSNEENTTKIDSQYIIPKTAKPEIQTTEKLDIVTPVSKIPIFHIVDAKQTLYSISLLYNVKVQDIYEMNNLQSNELEKGQKLIIGFETETIKSAQDMRVKISEKTPIMHLVRPRETIYSIAEWYKIKPDDIKRWNQLPNYNLKDSMEIIVGYYKPTIETRPDAPPIENNSIAKPDFKESQFPKYHFVNAGETLYAISKKYDVPINDLIKINQITSFDLSVGQKLIVGYESLKTEQPATTLQKETEPKPILAETNDSKNTAPTKHKVEKGETLYSISRKYEIPVETLIQANPIAPDQLKEGQFLNIPNLKTETFSPESKVNVSQQDIPAIHIVQKGETLFGISKKYEISVSDLILFNQLSSSGVIENQKLHLKPPSTSQKSTEISAKKVNVLQIKEPENTTATDLNPIMMDGIKYHVVKKDETLYRLSINYKVSIEKLQEWNNMNDFNLIEGKRYIVGK